MFSEKERSVLNLVTTLLALIFLYVVAFAEIFVRAGEIAWWTPIAQLFFIIIGGQWGRIKVPANTRATQVYIAIVASLCFLPDLFMKSFGLVSFPLFVGWVMTFIGQLMSLLKKAYFDQ
ncbi:MAG: hypothetical protein HZC04_00490 [Candidatus Lloydbacteria bacterium]|nr:hypothetical protein [Candidatus Lloydbacteria bacterium]